MESLPCQSLGESQPWPTQGLRRDSDPDMLRLGSGIMTSGKPPPANLCDPEEPWVRKPEILTPRQPRTKTFFHLWFRRSGSDSGS